MAAILDTTQRVISAAKTSCGGGYGKHTLRKMTSLAMEHTRNSGLETKSSLRRSRGHEYMRTAPFALAVFWGEGETVGLE
jgi:hypothetical protein